VPPPSNDERESIAEKSLSEQHWGQTTILLDCIRAFDKPAAEIYVVDTSVTLMPASQNAAGDDADWVNEIHPNAAGYAKLAAKLKPQLAALGVS